MWESVTYAPFTCIQKWPLWHYTTQTWSEYSPITVAGHVQTLSKTNKQPDKRWKAKVPVVYQKINESSKDIHNTLDRKIQKKSRYDF